MNRDLIFELATEKDDPALRRLLAANAMPGRITVTFEREPNYFLGCGTMGSFWQVLVGRHRPSDTVVAVLCRATQPRFVNGQVREIGYLGQLRVDDAFRGRWVLQQGIAALRQLHADGRAGHYLIAISDENRVALGVLVEHPRPSFPRMRELAHLHTLGIILRRPKAALPTPYRIERGSPDTLPEIVSFMREHGAARQFFPAYTKSDFVGDRQATTRGFDLADLFVARRETQIVGTLGLWDQSKYKQSVVKSYSGYLRWIRPFYNLGARLLGTQPLPGPGEHIRSVYASFICITGEDEAAQMAVFHTLLRQAYNLAAERRYAHLMLGLAENDPLRSVAREYAHITYHSRLFLAYWEDRDRLCEQLDDRVPYIEIAAL
ncbi:MAG: hypothetical protein JXA89_00910 [Anaerolineae bacterium]|nr:hypothetical protein [Anaerolineae bacterium]